MTEDKRDTDDQELKKMFPDEKMTDPPLIDIFLDVCERESPGFKKRILERGVLNHRPKQ